jgi:hypothetical protein
MLWRRYGQQVKIDVYEKHTEKMRHKDIFLLRIFGKQQEICMLQAKIFDVDVPVQQE